MNARILVVALATACIPAVAARAGDACPIVGDVSGDGVIDLDDHTAFASCLAGPDISVPPVGCDPAEFTASDLDEDGDVDVHDFRLMSLVFGGSYFDYGPTRPNGEAEMLAMEVSGQLRAPDAEYERILFDLAQIRAAYPELETVIADPEYMPNQLIVSVDDAQPLDGYEELNAYYQMIDEDVHSWGRVLTYCDNLNAPVLGNLYAALPEVNWAEPNLFIGMDDFISIMPTPDALRYSIDDGFWDCFDGCDCHRLWELDVDEFGTVTLISYEEVGQPWCDF